MAAKNLAVVKDGEIVIHGDPLNPTSADVIARVPLGSRRSTGDYTAALNLAGWIVTRPWGWTQTADGALPSAPVEKL